MVLITSRQKSLPSVNFSRTFAGSEAGELSSNTETGAAISTEPCEGSFKSYEKEKTDSEMGYKSREDEGEEDLLPPPSFFFEEPASLKGEVMRASCQLISPIRIVPGWFAITPTSLHFLQNHAEPVSNEIDVGNGMCSSSGA